MNFGLMLTLAVLVFAGLFILAAGNDSLSTRVIFVASIVFPLFLAGKGVEFVVENQVRKALLSILLLSLVCMLSIIFVFV
jgi:peptidoglycan/LPS O-acetylase OafA/YrhL